MEYQATLIFGVVVLALAIVTVRGIMRKPARAGRLEHWIPHARRALASTLANECAGGAPSPGGLDPATEPAFRTVPLSRTAAQAFVRAWLDARAIAKDDLDAGVTACDRLLGEVMCTLGYPLGDLESFADALSQNHAAVMGHYAEAHGLARQHEDGMASRNDLIRAMDHFEELFEHLLLPTRSDLRPA